MCALSECARNLTAYGLNAATLREGNMELNMFSRKIVNFGVGIVLSLLLARLPAWSQNSGEVRGQVFDPSGAAIPSAAVSLTHGDETRTTLTNANGTYNFHSVASGQWKIEVAAAGFQVASINVEIQGNQSEQVNVHLEIAVQHENVSVPFYSGSVSVNPDENGNSIVLKGEALNALSDDPVELRNELRALAGPAAGPNGGDIYIDGFIGGHLPPKSSIREIRINQNPFSTEFDRLGYGSIEILTKPGGGKLSGSVAAYGTDSIWNTGNPLVQHQPEYNFYFIQGTLSGGLKKKASWFFNIFDFQKKTNALINAIDPANLSEPLRQAVPNPSSIVNVSGRFDTQLSANITLSLRESFDQNKQKNLGVGALNLARQAAQSSNKENVLQASLSTIVNVHYMNETRFQWRSLRNSITPDFLVPQETVQGSFVDGGNSSGSSEDHRDDLELQNYSTATFGSHLARFGVCLRSYNDSNSSSAGTNGTYSFASLEAYNAGTPYLYTQTIVTQPKVHALLFDGAAFYQDDWRWKPNLTLSYGLRIEGQSHIENHLNWAPRLAVAWAPRKSGQKSQSTVIHAGYGFFYTRFIGPSNLSSPDAVPYWTQMLHNNRVNQQSYTIADPSFYQPDSALTASELGAITGASSYVSTIDPHFRAATDMQGAITVDQQIRKFAVASVSYIYTRGVHQYLMSAVNAPGFDTSTYSLTGSRPSEFNYQFQSTGVYKQSQVILTVHTGFRRVGVDALYAFNDAHSDTQGATWYSSVAAQPSLDYGRAGFATRHSVFLLGNINAPYKISLAPVVGAQSGTPYNITTGSDLTGNNQSNARPTFGVCGASDVVKTDFGCLDVNPVGKGERMIPFNLGTGPINVMVRLSISRAFGIGPHIRGATLAQAVGEGSVGGGLNGGGSQMSMGSKSSVPRRFNLTFSAIATNLVNFVNWGPPNGVLASPLFAKSQSLASGLFESPSPGNRTIVFRSVFSF